MPRAKPLKLFEMTKREMFVLMDKQTTTDHQTPLKYARTAQIDVFHGSRFLRMGRVIEIAMLPV